MQSDSLGAARMPAGGTVLYRCGKLDEPGDRVIEELLIAFAEIAFLCALAIIPAGSVFHTTTPADVQVSANEALGAECFLVSREGAFSLIAGELLNGRLKDVA